MRLGFDANKVLRNRTWTVVAGHLRSPAILVVGDVVRSAPMMAAALARGQRFG
jgi:siroheme synthase